jgi:hypothetical protein
LRLAGLAGTDGLALFFDLGAQQSGLQLLETRLVGISGETLGDDGGSAIDIAIGLHAAGLGEAPGDEILAFAIGNARGEALSGRMVGLDLEDLLHESVGGIPIGIDKAAGLVEERVHQHGANNGIAGIERGSFTQAGQGVFGRAFLTGLAGASEQFERLGAAPLALTDELFEFEQLGFTGEFGEGAFHGLQGALVVAALAVSRAC